MVGREGHVARFFLFSIGIREVDVLPVAYQLIFRNGYLRDSSVTFGHYDRPACTRPFDRTYMSHHEGIAISISFHILGKSALWGVIPVAVAVVKHSTMWDSYPSIAVAEFVGVSNDGQHFSSILGKIDTVYAEVGTIDISGAADTGIVGGVQCVISYK